MYSLSYTVITINHFNNSIYYIKCGGQKKFSFFENYLTSKTIILTIFRLFFFLHASLLQILKEQNCE